MPVLGGNAGGTSDWFSSINRFLLCALDEAKWSSPLDCGHRNQERPDKFKFKYPRIHVEFLFIFHSVDFKAFLKESLGI